MMTEKAWEFDKVFRDSDN
jgi:kinesin family protein C2/C3